MAQIHIRLDDRLVHSETIFACVPAWKPKTVMVASELDWVDVVEAKELMDSEFAVVKPADVPSRLDAVEPVLLLFGTALDLVKGWCDSFACEPITLANRAKRAETVPISETYHADRAEVAALLQLQAMGGCFLVQRIPTEAPRSVDLREIAGRFSDLTVKQNPRAQQRGSC